MMEETIELTRLNTGGILETINQFLTQLFQVVISSRGPNPLILNGPQTKLPALMKIMKRKKQPLSSSSSQPLNVFVIPSNQWFSHALDTAKEIFTYIFHLMISQPHVTSYPCNLNPKIWGFAMALGSLILALDVMAVKSCKA